MDKLVQHVENVILTAAAGIKAEIRELNGDSGQIHQFLSQKTRAKDVLGAVNFLLRQAGQDPVEEVSFFDILEAETVITVNKADPFFKARLVRYPAGLLAELYVPAGKYKEYLITKLRTYYPKKVEKVEERKPLESLKIKELEELCYKFSGFHPS